MLSQESQIAASTCLFSLAIILLQQSIFQSPIRQSKADRWSSGKKGSRKLSFWFSLKLSPLPLICLLSEVLNLSCSVSPNNKYLIYCLSVGVKNQKDLTALLEIFHIPSHFPPCFPPTLSVAPSISGSGLCLLQLVSHPCCLCA